MKKGKEQLSSDARPFSYCHGAVRITVGQWSSGLAKRSKTHPIKIGMIED
jgi:hypothetical protein